MTLTVFLKLSISLLIALFHTSRTLAYQTAHPTNGIVLDQSTAKRISKTSQQAGYLDSVQDDQREKPHIHLHYEPCVPYTGETQLSDSNQHLRPIQELDPNFRTFFTHFHDINGARVDLKVLLYTEGRLEILSEVNRMYRPFHDEVTLHASTYSPLYDFAASESWAIDIQRSSQCGIQSNLPVERVSGFKVWY